MDVTLNKSPKKPLPSKNTGKTKQSEPALRKTRGNHRTLSIFFYQYLIFNVTFHYLKQVKSLMIVFIVIEV